MVYQKLLFHERYDIGPNREAGVRLVLLNNPLPTSSASRAVRERTKGKEELNMGLKARELGTSQSKTAAFPGQSYKYKDKYQHIQPSESGIEAGTSRTEESVHTTPSGPVLYNLAQRRLTTEKAELLSRCNSLSRFAM
jgi:hypothetical protein